MPVLIFLSSLAYVIETYPTTLAASLISALVFISLAIVVLALRKRLRKALFSADAASRWRDEADPIAFEQRCAEAMRRSGWAAQTTKGSGDQGIDVLAEKNGVRVVIQCKYYSSVVGNKAVQQAFAGRSFAGADHAAVVTNSRFSASAHELARSTGVHLLHFTELRQANRIFVAPADSAADDSGRFPGAENLFGHLRRTVLLLALLAAVAVAVSYHQDVGKLRPDAPPEHATNKFVTAKIAVYIRNAPGPGGDIVRIAASGETFRVFGNTTGWTRIGKDEPIGWIASSLLSDD